MALEDLTGPNVYISNLVPANPPETDPAEQGCDHIQGIKNVLQNTFPGMAGPYAFGPSSKDMTWEVGGSVRMQITPAGTVLVNKPTADGLGVLQLNVAGDYTNTSTFAQGITDPKFCIGFANGVTGLASGTLQGRMGMFYVGVGPNATVDFHRGGSSNDGEMRFNTTSAERMRIRTDGTISINGDIDPSGQVAIGFDKTTRHGLLFRQTSDTGGGGNIQQYINAAGTAIGSISGTASGVSFNTTSDYRLKEQVAPMTGAVDRVLALNPVTYKWIIDGSAGEGFLAHELKEVVPLAVTGEKDGEQMQAVDYSKLVPILVSAIQELKAEIDALKAQ
jgi:hypothetical protein